MEMITQPAVYSIMFYFKNYCKMKAIDLSNQQALDADSNAM